MQADVMPVVSVVTGAPEREWVDEVALAPVIAVAGTTTGVATFRRPSDRQLTATAFEAELLASACGGRR